MCYSELSEFSFRFPGEIVVLLQLPHIGENFFLNCIKNVELQHFTVF